MSFSVAMFTFLLSLMCASIVEEVLIGSPVFVNKARFFDAVTVTQRLTNVIRLHSPFLAYRIEKNFCYFLENFTRREEAMETVAYADFARWKCASERLWK